MNGSHVIKRQVLEVEVASKEDADSAMEKFREDYYSLYLPTINQVLDELNPDDSITIEELSLDLGEIYPDEPREAITQRIAVSLRASLGLAPRIDQSLPAAKKKIVTGNEKRLEILEHFLQYGTLPWWASQKDDVMAVTRVLIAEVPGELKVLLKENLARESTKKRMCTQFSEDLLGELAYLLNPSVRPGIKDLVADLASVMTKIFRGANASAASARESAWGSALLASAATTTEREFTRALLRELRKVISAYDHKADPGGKITSSEGETTSSIQQELHEAIGSNDRKVNPEERIIRVLNKHGLVTERESMEDHQKEKEIKHPEERQPEPGDDHDAAALPGEDALIEWFIENSGLCILSPYLQLFFTRLGMVQKNRFIDREKQERAVHILQYAVSGEEAAAENSLAFNKLLCGLDISEPIPRFISLTTEEKAECEALLTSIIKNWDALRSTSVDGLRHSFLLRKGILKQDELSWVLKAERKTYDMMMNKMPWSFSAIKLPWNDYAIQVQW